MAPQWPQIRESDPDCLAQQALTLQVHCTAIMQFAVEHPTRKADAQYVRNLAQMTNLVVTKLINKRLEETQAPPDGGVPSLPMPGIDVQVGAEPTSGTGTRTSSSATPSTRQLEQ